MWEQSAMATGVGWNSKLLYECKLGHKAKQKTTQRGQIREDNILQTPKINKTVL